MNRPNHLVHGPARPVVEPGARVQFKDYETKTGYVDGAWWPRSPDLATELPGLLAAVSPTLGTIHRVVYNTAEWNPVAGCEGVRLDGTRHGAAHTVEVLGARDRRRVLLIIPPRTDTHRACAVMALACRANDESTVDELLARLPGRTGRAAALRRWRNGATGRESTVAGRIHPSIERHCL
ncbi:DUF5994 family protein [Nocardia violaceofusca]|uniref:DUF5994 family protein n=1 Tax=Nocardia violaceofusca TaxID=941182 RepID=UPI000AB1B5CF|nr:DUF5994 family protein [Nocardia violaceofusca]